MIAQIVSLIAEFWWFLSFFVVLDQEQKGFIRRFGRHDRALRAGWNWKWPGIEVAEKEDARCFPYILEPQSLTTLDKKSVVLRMSVLARITNVKKYFRAVYDGRTNIQDLAAGELGDAVAVTEAEDVLSGAVLSIVLERTQVAARAWGMQVDAVKFIDATETTSYRLWQTQTTGVGQE